MDKCKKLLREQKSFEYGELAARKGDSDSDSHESDMDISDLSCDNESDRDYAGFFVN